MKLWAISDLHLSAAKPKPMDIFGAQWRDHPAKIAAAWRDLVRPEDVVLCPGDISWAMTIEEALPDLQYLADLPGKKILLRGNHDYWWKRKATGALRKLLPESIEVLQGNAIALSDEWALIGSRGWRYPGEISVGDHPHPAVKMTEEGDDEKIFARELEYLRRSIEDLPRLGGKRKVIGMMHYPPFSWRPLQSPFAALISAAGAELCIYGHLHGNDIYRAFQGTRNGVEYRLVSADAVQFRPILLR